MDDDDGLFTFALEEVVAQDAKDYAAQRRGAIRGAGNVICKHWLRSLCKRGDDCPFVHELNARMMPVCQFFLTHGECANDDCVFRHLDEEERLCPWYERGMCRHGPRCKMTHRRRRMCRDYFVGFCPLGASCHLAHPKFELPDERGQNRVDDGVMELYSRDPHAVICYRCGKVGHKAPECTAPKSEWVPRDSFKRDFSNVTCYKCKGKGHYADACPFLKH